MCNDNRQGRSRRGRIMICFKSLSPTQSYPECICVLWSINSFTDSFLGQDKERAEFMTLLTTKLSRNEWSVWDANFEIEAKTIARLSINVEWVWQVLSNFLFFLTSSNNVNIYFGEGKRKTSTPFRFVHPLTVPWECLGQFIRFRSLPKLYYFLLNECFSRTANCFGDKKIRKIKNFCPAGIIDDDTIYGDWDCEMFIKIIRQKISSPTEPNKVLD